MSDRDELVGYIRRELYGPAGDPEEEVHDPPHRRYLTGTLFAQEAASDQVLVEDGGEVDIGGQTDGGGMADDPVSLANQWLPSSIGMTFFLSGDAEVDCVLSAARYESTGKRSWTRRVLPVETVKLTEAESLRDVLDDRATLRAFWRPFASGRLVTVTLTNQQLQALPGQIEAEGCLFQVSLRCDAGAARILEYPSTQLLSRDPEEQELRLLYRHKKAFAIGHGAAAMWDPAAGDAVDQIWVDFLPTHEVPPLTFSTGTENRALQLSFLADPKTSAEELLGSLEEFLAAYEKWIRGLGPRNGDIPDELEAARGRILSRLDDASERMREGIELLRRDEEVRTCFVAANRAMLAQMIHAGDDFGGTRRKVGDSVYEKPDELSGSQSWRPFQLAFLLMVLPSLLDESATDREIVDLIWFPTGGGKTEAYLAAASASILYRRLKRGQRGGGTTVITRYTLRLLSSQQFQRSATLICALERLRVENPQLFGDEPISIGFWVGQGVTPNKFKDARDLFEDMLGEMQPVNRFQLETCPWCGTEIVPTGAEPDPSEVGIRATNSSFYFYCPNETCPFHDRLPVTVIDEDMYQRPPTMLISTVDKFARMAWEEKAGAFFGLGGYEPPTLIIQDELHLLSGPLGTTVGVYEAALQALCARLGAPPKIIASTATIRRANDQVNGLFAREVRVFPPSGLDSSDSYFARVDAEKPGRLYVGLMSQSHTNQTTIVHSAAALLQAASELSLSEEAMDAYWTLVLYHNSLRELGITVTLARDDVPARIKVISSVEEHERRVPDDSVVELTSNVPGTELPSILSRMESSMKDPDPISMLITTNMLSVGVDVPRLGLMFVNGQPKTTSEYIQATSRVGRGRVPGVILTMYSATRPRDRSHYESFLPYHQSLYRFVEPTSVTPFALPSRRRALHAAFVVLVRTLTNMGRNDAAGEFDSSSPEIVQIVQLLADTVKRVDPDEASRTVEHLQNLAAEWHALAEQARNNGQSLYYQARGKESIALLRDFAGRGDGWETLNSMRSVDREAGIILVGEQK